MKDRVALFCVLFSFAAAGSAFAAEQEDITAKYKETRPAIPRQAAQYETVQDRFKLRTTVGLFEGFDNNVFLDSSRQSDMFDQAGIGLGLKYDASRDLKLNVKGGLTTITYHEVTDATMLNSNAKAFFDYFCGPVKTYAGYGIDDYYYPRNEDGDFFVHGPFAGARYYCLDPKFYLGAMYNYEMYDYQHRPIRNGEDAVLEQDRDDKRHNIIGESGIYCGKTVYKLKNTLYFNDSNDEFMDYYDYWADRIMGYVTWPVWCDKLFVTLEGGYQYKHFYSRETTESTSKEHDNLMILGAGFYYEICKSFYASFNYSYRENYSNNPVSEYSGSMYTAGVSYSF